MGALEELRAKIEESDVDGVLSDWYALLDLAERELRGSVAAVAEHDPVTAPAHYAGDGEVECKRALSSMLAGYAGASRAATYWAGCALKYLWRWPLKNGAQDIEKAIECLRLLRDEIGEEGR